MVQKIVKKNFEYESILYNSNKLSFDWTFREFQNQTILFSRKVKSSIYIILKLLSLFHIFF